MRVTSILIGLGLLFVDGSTALAQRTGLWAQGASGSLELVQHDVEVKISHPVAEVTVTQEFYNPLQRALETYYYYPVAPGATVSNLALWVNGVRREARLMERQKAREIYQGIVNQKRDPALVEKLAGNLFRIRIFPVLPKRRTRVELRFVQVVEEAGPDSYRFVLQKPPGKPSDVLRLAVELDAPFSLATAKLTGWKGGRLRKEGAFYALRRRAGAQRFAADISLTYQRKGKPVMIVQEGKDGTFVAEIPHQATSLQRSKMAILLDVSESMSPHLPRAKKVVAELLATLPAARPVSILPFDLLPRDASGNSRAKQLEDVARLHCQGGSAFMPAFEEARRRGAKQLMLLSDGGSRFHQQELEHLMRWAYDRPELSISVLQFGAGSNGDLLADIASATGGLYLRLSPEPPEAGTDVVEKLVAHQPRQRLPNADGNALHLVSQGAHRLVVAGKRCEKDCGEATVKLPDGVLLPTRPNDVSREVRGVGALWATAEIDQLMRQIRLFGDEAVIRPQISALSQRFRVVSEYTAMLVTETDADYNRPTTGRKWQRQVHGMGEDTPSFHSTPEPHELLLIGLALLFFAAARRNGGLVSRGPRRQG